MSDGDPTQKGRRDQDRAAGAIFVVLMCVIGLLYAVNRLDDIGAAVALARSRWECEHAGGVLWMHQEDGSYRPRGEATGLVELSNDFALDAQEHLWVLDKESDELVPIPGVDHAVAVIGLDGWPSAQPPHAYVLLADGSVVGVTTDRTVVPILDAGDRTSMAMINDQLYVVDAEGTVWLVPLAPAVDSLASLERIDEPRPVQGLTGVRSMGVLWPQADQLIMAVLLDGTVVVWPYDEEFTSADVAHPVPVPGLEGVTDMAQSKFGVKAWYGGLGGHLVGSVIDGFGKPRSVVRSVEGEVRIDDQEPYPDVALSLGWIGHHGAQVVGEDGALRSFGRSEGQDADTWESDPFLAGVTAVEPRNGYTVICGSP